MAEMLGSCPVISRSSPEKPLYGTKNRNLQEDVVSEGEADPSGGEFVEVRGLAIIFCQAAPPLFIEDPQVGLRRGIPPIGGELIEARRSPFILC